MNINGITSISGYVSMLSKQSQAQRRMLGEKEKYFSIFMKQNNDNYKTVRLESILSKLKQGRKLSSDDMEYLRNNAPSMYEKALKIQKEREEYRKALENCKTKDEARMVHIMKMSQFAAEMKSASSNKYGDIQWIDVRAAAMLSEFIDFVKSDRYGKIPNEYEIDREKNEKSEAEFEYPTQNCEVEDVYSSYDDKKHETKDANASNNDKKADNIERYGTANGFEISQTREIRQMSAKNDKSA
ncbi:MAG: hypothetical protein LBH98_02605 [Chitinispirillales bacterium]|jgi:hypothetical protein|nr:hypothetical protein [Chitinispirillales bacterium]